MKKKIALVILSDPMIYPPTVNAANILDENGWDVTIIGIKYLTNETIRFNKTCKLVYWGSHKKGIKNIIQYLTIYLRLYLDSKRNKYSWIIAYDVGIIGPVILVSRLLKIKWGYHNHDLLENPKGWHKILKWIELTFTKRANFVSFPQENRADQFRIQANLKYNPLIVNNGPRTKWISNVPPHQHIVKIKQKYENILVYQGGLASVFGLDKIFEAFHFSKSTYALCLMGKELEVGIRKSYEEKINQLHLNDKVFFIDLLPYDMMPSITNYSTIGIAKFAYNENAPINDYYLIGASNKITEYLACGLPVLAPDTPVNRVFFDQYKIGYLCNPDDPMDIASSIDALVTDKDKYDEISSNNYRLFKEFLCYDKQFEKVLIELNK